MAPCTLTVNMSVFSFFLNVSVCVADDANAYSIGKLFQTSGSATPKARFPNSILVSVHVLVKLWFDADRVCRLPCRADDGGHGGHDVQEGTTAVVDNVVHREALSDWQTVATAKLALAVSAAEVQHRTGSCVKDRRVATLWPLEGQPVLHPNGRAMEFETTTATPIEHILDATICGRLI
jgi:hypothetical protein